MEFITNDGHIFEAEDFESACVKILDWLGVSIEEHKK